ncbi:hypothetical protein [Nonomuraea sp. NPDC003709]|uniref:hypothetical protein n=1 Tax=Nonomuraea sp. NPDC003709 TaxID=3154450 RepID=UPI0033AD688D
MSEDAVAVFDRDGEKVLDEVFRRAAVLEDGSELVEDVAFHDLRPESGEPLGALIDPADERADVVAALKQPQVVLRPPGHRR